MQYLMSVIMDESALPDAESMEHVYKSVDVYNKELQGKNRWVFGGGLEPVKHATTIRLDNNDVTVTDGPYAETKEVLGGFWIIKADNQTDALEWAKRASIACRGTVELRQFQDEPEA